MKKITMPLAAMLLALLCIGNSYAETLTVDTGGPVAASATGVTVNINIDDGSNTAGAAFTVTYDDTMLTLTDVSSSFFATFAAQSIDPDSVLMEGDTEPYTQGLVSNLTSGGVRIAAAQAYNGNPGAHTLFTLTFDVDGDASGDYPIAIIKTIINNPLAGYDPNDEISDELAMLIGVGEGGDTYPEVILDPSTPTPGILTVTTSGPVDTDGDGIDDVWETLYFGNLTTADAFSDFDMDGYTDRQEFINGASYHPKVANLPGGPGYNGLTDNGWQQLDETLAENFVPFRDGIAVDFGIEGLFYFDGLTWTLLNSEDPQIMVQANVDNDNDMELVAYFPGFGVFVWDGSWGTKLSSIMPEEMVAFGNKVAIDFGAGYGLYLYDTTNGLTKINNVNPSFLAVADIDSDGIMELASYFSGYGIYTWDSGWTKISSAVPEGIISFGDALAIDFGSTYGLYKYSVGSKFTRLSPFNPSHLASADIDNDGTAELTAFFQGYGIYVWDGSWSSMITTAEPENVLAMENVFMFDMGTMGIYSYVDHLGFTRKIDKDPSLMVANGTNIFCNISSGVFMFLNESKGAMQNTLVLNQPGDGLYLYNNTDSLTQIEATESTMAVSVDFDDNGTDEIVAYFPGNGISAWDGNSWTSISPLVPENLLVLNNEVVIDFESPDALNLYSPAKGLVEINSVNPSILAVSDVDGDEIDELAAAFPGYGLYIWDGAWGAKINAVEPENMIAFGGDSLAVDFGVADGLWIYNDASGFIQLSSSDTSLLASADVDSDGIDELTAFFPGYGVYTWDESWSSRINSYEPESMMRFGNSLAMDFGSAFGLYTYNIGSGYTKLTSLDSSSLGVADVDNDGKSELAAYLVGYGLYIWDSGWSKQLTALKPDFIVPSLQ